MPLGESQRLARLQHANIVPLLFAEAFDGFYLLGMPLLGVVTLKDIIEEVEGRDGQSGDIVANFLDSRFSQIRDLLPELSEHSSSPPGHIGRTRNPLDDIREASWEKTILSMIAKLADGLDYAHRRGLQHRDIKPANILVGFDGQPMLLDFNLSRDHTSTSIDRTFGGTLPYMPPEQIECPESLNDSNEDLGIQGDIYSLGVVLYEALTGRRPHDFSQCPSGDASIAGELKRIEIIRPTHLNTSLSPAAEAIVLKCLEYRPSLRYKQASDLSDDIRLHLSDYPLRYCKNPSRTERVKKWVRRNKSAFSLGSLAMVAAASLVASSIVALSFYQKACRLAAEERCEDFRTAAVRAETSLFFADGGSRDIGRKTAIEALRIVGSEGQDPPSSTLMEWLGATERGELNTAVDYLRTLLKAENSVTSQTFANVETQDRLIRATQLYFADRYSEAIVELDSEIDNDSQRFVVWFLKGRAHFNLNEYWQAKQALVMASAIEPDSATCWVARGTCDHQLGNYVEAIESYDRAIECEPANFPAFYNRALAYERLEEYEKALESLSAAELIQPNSTRVRMARSRSARAAGDVDLANDELQRSIEATPSAPEDWILRGLARLSSDASGALKDFAEAKNGRRLAQSRIKTQHMCSAKYLINLKMQLPNFRNC